MSKRERPSEVGRRDGDRERRQVVALADVLLRGGERGQEGEGGSEASGDHALVPGMRWAGGTQDPTDGTGRAHRSSHRFRGPEDGDSASCGRTKPGSGGFSSRSPDSVRPSLRALRATVPRGQNTVLSKSRSALPTNIGEFHWTAMLPLAVLAPTRSISAPRTSIA